MTETSNKSGETLVAQHPPAVKVGGRRLSLTNKHRPHVAPTAPSDSVPDQASSPPTDYPRPAGHNEDHHDHEHQEHDEVPPKRDRKHSHDRAPEYAFKKGLDSGKQLKTGKAAKDSFGAGGRIAQPAKAMNI